MESIASVLINAFYLSNMINPRHAEMIYVLCTHCHYFSYKYAEIFRISGDATKVRFWEMEKQINSLFINIAII